MLEKGLLWDTSGLYFYPKDFIDVAPRYDIPQCYQTWDWTQVFRISPDRALVTNISTSGMLQN